jgi:hypothetical protein
MATSASVLLLRMVISPVPARLAVSCGPTHQFVVGGDTRPAEADRVIHPPGQPIDPAAEDLLHARLDPLGQLRRTDAVAALKLALPEVEVARLLRLGGAAQRGTRLGRRALGFSGCRRLAHPTDGRQ